MLQLTTVDLQKTKTETLVIPVCVDTQIYDNRALVSIINQAKKLKEFKGEKNDEVTLFGPSEVKAERVIFLGLGKLEKIDLETLRSIAGKAVKKCITKNLSQVLIAVPSEKRIKIDMSRMLTALMEGSFLGNHIYD